MILCYYHVTYAFWSESTSYSCLNLKELLARNRRDIWSLSDCNGIRTHNLLFRKRILYRIAKLALWLSVSLRTEWLWVRISLQSLKLQICLRYLINFLQIEKMWKILLTYFCITFVLLAYIFEARFFTLVMRVTKKMKTGLIKTQKSFMKIWGFKGAL